VAGRVEPVFLGWLAIMQHEFISKGAKINKERYEEVFTHLQEAICLKHPEM
jgi:hypothetical protein